MAFRLTFGTVCLAFDPLAIRLAGGDHAVHEAHAQQAVQRVGEVQRQRVDRCAGAAGGDGFGGVGIGPNPTSVSPGATRS